MLSRRFRELTGAGFVLSTLFVGAGQSAGDTSEGTGSTEDPNVQDTPDSSIQRARIISGLEAWPGIRSLWRELDLMEPGENGYSYGIMDWEQANLMREKLNNLYFEMAAAMESDSLSTIELNLIVNVTRMRIDMMSSGMPSMMTRMMPPPIEYDKGALVEEMERQIDHLLDLRDQGMLSVDQVRSATGTILDTFMAISVMDTISAAYGYPYMYGFSIDILTGVDSLASDTALNAVAMADMALAELEREFLAVTAPDTELPDYIDREEMSIRYAGTLEAIAEVRRVATGAGFLLGDLLLGAD